MSPKWIDILAAAIACLAGGALRMTATYLGDWPYLIFIAVVLAAFGWIFAKTRFSSTRYTPRIRSIQTTTLWGVIGFNLAAFIEGFE